MKNFYRLAEGMVDAVHAMDALMHRQALLTSVSEGIDVIQLRSSDFQSHAEFVNFQVARRMALGVMRICDGVALGRVDIVRLAHTAKIVDFGAAANMAHYIVVLQGADGAQLILGDETVNLKSGEIWYADLTQEGVLMNRSGDDLVLLTVDVQVDK